MTGLNAYLARRGIGEDQMERACQATREYVDAYALRQARSEQGMTQMELA